MFQEDYEYSVYDLLSKMFRKEDFPIEFNENGRIIAEQKTDTALTAKVEMVKNHSLGAKNGNRRQNQQTHMYAQTRKECKRTHKTAVHQELRSYVCEVCDRRFTNLISNTTCSRIPARDLSHVTSVIYSINKFETA